MNEQRRPKFDERSIRKRVLFETLQHPATLFPIGIGLVAGVGLAVLSSLSSLIIGLAAGGGLLFGTAAWLLNYYGRGSLFEGRYHRELHDFFQKEKEERKRKLIQDLRHREVGCVLGERQVEQLDEKFGKIQQVLMRKLHAGELTYSRFLGTAEDVYRSALKNLEQVVAVRFSMDDKNIESDRKTAKRLEGKPNRSGAEAKVLEATQESIRIYDASAKQVDDLLAENEVALTALDKAASAIARMDTGGSTGTMEGAMEELVRLVENKTGRSERIDVNLNHNNERFR